MCSMAKKLFSVFKRLDTCILLKLYILIVSDSISNLCHLTKCHFPTQNTDENLSPSPLRQYILHR